MALEIRGGVRAAALPGDTPLQRQAARLLGDLRERDADPRYIQDQARQLEADGLDSALVTVYSAWPDPWLVAGWALAASQQLRLTVAHRPGVMQPTAAARSLATLDKLSGGRAAVHLVIGSSDADVQRDGDFLSKDQRYERAREYLEIFTRTLEHSEPFDYQGRFYRVTDSSSGVRPVQQPRPPVSIGGASPQAKALAAQFADIYAGSYTSPEQAATVVKELQLLARGYDRQLRFWRHFKVILGTDDAHAQQRASHLLEQAGVQLQQRSARQLRTSPQVARDRERTASEVLQTQSLEHWAHKDLQDNFAQWLVGSVATVAERLLAFYRAGIDIIQIEAALEDEQDLRLRRQLVSELRRLSNDE